MKTKLNPLNVTTAIALFLCLFMAAPHCQAQPASLRDEISGQTIDSTATKVIVLIHGWNPENTTDKYSSSNPEWFSLVTALKSKLAGSDWKLITYHWEQQGTISPSIGANTGDVWHHLLINDFFGYGNGTEAAVHAEQQGASLSSLLNSQAPGLRKVHFIAHSAGSWAAREAMRLLLNSNASVVCQMTLLDPFIPDASSLVETTTGLSTSKMSATTGLPGNSRIQRLEDYYAEDTIDQCNTPTISTPGAEFTWRASDKNLRVDWGDSGFPGLSLWYDCHSGPVQFYADTVRFVDFAPAYGGLQSPDFDLNDIGWKKSLFYQEQQLRATITGVSPAMLPTSSSSQLITISGTNFKFSGDPNASSLIFYDPANNAYPRTPINVTTTSMQYNLNVQSAAGTWKVKVVSGGVESLPFSFTVTSSGSQLTGLSISGPATVVENNSGQFTATAYFSDGSSSTVTSSTSWSENSSVTSISSSGLLSAGSVSSDTAVTVSASYTLNGIAKATSANVTVVNSGSGGGTTTIHPLVNGTFESGASPWSPSGYADVVALSYPHLGSWYAYLCNANNADGSFAQFFPIPAGATAATIQFYLNVVSSETSTTTAFDTMKVDLATGSDQYVGTIAQFSNLDKGANGNGSYVLKSYNIMPLVSAYKGQSLFLIFAGHTDAGLSTIFRIDDVDITLTVDNPVSLTGLSIRGPSSIPEGRGDTFWADAIFSDGTTQTISPNSWSESSSVTTISSDGFLSAGSVGSDTAVTVTASYTFNGVTQQATKSVTIVGINAAHTLTSLAISGPSSMNENSSGQFTATAIFADGTSQTVTPTWSENSSATTISSGGVLNAGEVGGDTTVTVSASYTTGGITQNASQGVLVINVPTPPTLASVTINGPNSLNENTTAQYYTTAAFSDGTSQVVAPTWSEDSAATSIAISGLLNAGEVANNTSVTISASYTVGGSTRSAQKTVTVLNTTGLPTYTLTVNAVNGTVTKSPDQANYESGSQVVLTAVPANGYLFNVWSGDATGSQNPLMVTITTNMSIVVNFTAAPISSNRLTSINISNGLVSFYLNGPGGSNYVVQYSTNLVNWVSLVTNVIPSGGIRVVDFPMQTSPAEMFYRALPISQDPLVLQPGPSDGKDIFTTSVYSYADGGSGPGGGANDFHLRVGGWGDFYYSLLQFDLSVLPTNASSAVLYLYCYNLSGGGTPLYLDRITQKWDWRTMGTGRDHDRLWWADRPSAEQWSDGQLATPDAGQWYAVDITTLYNAWGNGTWPNYGLQFRPVLNFNNNFDEFYSADYIGDPTLRPKLVITPATNPLGEAVVIASSLNGPRRMALDGGYIYFTDDSDHNGILKRVGKNGGDVATLATGLQTWESWGATFEVCGDTIFGHYGGYQACNIFSLPSAGGSATTLCSITGGSFIGVLGSQVYFGSDFNTINSIPTTGGSRTQIAANNWVRSFASDESAIYYVEYFSKDVRKLTSSGTISTLIGGNSSEGTVFIDTDNVFFNVAGNIQKVPKSGGAVVTLVSSGGASGYASDNTNIFFLEGNVIKSVPVSGGNTSALMAVPADSLSSLVVDKAFIYWTDLSGGDSAGQIWKMAKP